LCLFTLLSLVVGACTQQGGGPTATQGEAADPKGELVTNMRIEADSIDPQVASYVHEIGVIMRVFEALMTPDLKTGKPIPASAKDQPKVSADGKTYTYTLRDGLKYSDGQPVTSKNFKYGWQRLCDPATAGNYLEVGAANSREAELLNATLDAPLFVVWTVSHLAAILFSPLGSNWEDFQMPYQRLAIRITPALALLPLAGAMGQTITNQFSLPNTTLLAGSTGNPLVLHASHDVICELIRPPDAGALRRFDVSANSLAIPNTRARNRSRALPRLPATQHLDDIQHV